MFLATFMLIILLWIFVERSYILLVKYIQKRKQIPVDNPPSGGGFVFPLSVFLLYALMYSSGYAPVTQILASNEPCDIWLLGLLVVCCVSGLDDYRPQPIIPRLGAQIVAIGLLFWQFSYVLDNTLVPWWAVTIAAVFMIGFLNMWNFMDGINGITGCMTLASLIPLLVLSGPSVYLWGIPAMMIPATIAFLGFNCRKKAACYAGDIGAISIAYILLFLWGSSLCLRWEFEVPAWWSVVFFSVYIVDAGWTIVLRLSRHENIFKPHLNHAYQHLCHRRGWNPVAVSVGYSVAQLGISLAAFAEPVQECIYWYVAGVFVVLTGAYFYIISRPATVEVSPTYAR